MFVASLTYLEGQLRFKNTGEETGLHSAIPVGAFFTHPSVALRRLMSSVATTTLLKIALQLHRKLLCTMQLRRGSSCLLLWIPAISL